MTKKNIQNNPKVLGLDISTKTIGWALFDIQTKELLELTHVSPRPKIKTENKIEELIAKSDVFKSKLVDYVNLGITKVVIEEPLLNSNNIYTVQTLLRYNSFVTKVIWDVLGIVPEFISTYNSRKYAFPHLLQTNDKGKVVLFGGLPKGLTMTSSVRLLLIVLFVLTKSNNSIRVMEKVTWKSIIVDTFISVGVVVRHITHKVL